MYKWHNKAKTIIGNDVETKLEIRNESHKNATIKQNEGEEKLIELEGSTAKRTCPAYALNYVAFNVMLSI